MNRTSSHLPLPSRHHARAFTVAELLLATILSAMLLVAMGAILNATLSNEAMNRETTDASQTGRMICERMSLDLRSASDVTLLTNGIRISPADTSRFTQIEFQYETAGDNAGDFLYRTTGATGTNTYVILDNNDPLTCTALSATLTTVDDILVVTTVNLTLDYEGTTYPFIASGAPRINAE